MHAGTIVCNVCIPMRLADGGANSVIAVMQANDKANVHEVNIVLVFLFTKLPTRHSLRH